MDSRKVIFCALLLCLPAITGQILLADESKIIWPVWDNNTPYPHTIFGRPDYNKNDPCHDVVREYGAFTVYYDDEVLSPRWTAIKVTHYIVDKNNKMKRPGTFKTDKQLKKEGYRVTKHTDYSNPLLGPKKWDRGHMVQFDDARGYGKQAGKDSFYTSNICPQLKVLNEKGWLALEKTCSEFARDYKVVWIYTGPIYDANKTPFAKGRKIPAPIAFYKIVLSPLDNNNVNVLAFRMPHELIPADVNVSKYLVTVRDIEKETGLDFFRDLPDNLEKQIETNKGNLWPDLPN
jgi:endonuclease G